MMVAERSFVDLHGGSVLRCGRACLLRLRPLGYRRKRMTRRCPCGLVFVRASNRQTYCTPEHKQRANDAKRGKSQPLTVESVTLYSIGARDYVGRSGHRPLLKHEIGELYCRGCDRFLGLVAGRVFIGPRHLIQGKRVACPHYCSDGDPVMTKITAALPINEPTTGETTHSSYRWTIVYDETGAVVAACCEESETIQLEAA
jgi:hypothetical protein